MTPVTPKLRWRLRTWLTVPMALLLLMSSIATGAFLLRANQRTAQRLTGELREQIRERVNAHVHSVLERAIEINASNAELLEIGALGFDSEESVERLQQHLAQQISRHPELSFAFVGTPRGGAVGAGRREDGRRTVDTTTFVEGVGPVAGSRTEWAVSPVGERLEVLGSRLGFDARLRPWFRAAVESEGPAWSPTYVFFAEQTVAIAASETVDRDGQLLAVVGVDLSLASLGEYLRSLTVPADARLFLAESDGRLLATSDPLRSDLRNPLDEVWSRRPAIDSSDPMIAAAAQAIEQAEAWNSTRQLALEAAVPGSTRGDLLVDVVPLDDIEQLDWVIVLASSRAALLDEVGRQTRWSLGFAAATLLLLLAVGALISNRVTRPAELLSTAARDLVLARGSLELPESRILELERLRGSFEQMARQVDESFVELEHRVEERTRALESARAQAEEANQAKTAFLSRVSHELRTPLTSVRGYLRLLQRRLQPEARSRGDHQTVEALEAVDASSAQLLALVDDLLDYQRAEEGRLPVAASRFELHRLIDELVRGFSGQAAARGLAFETEVDLPEEATLLSDRRRLGQILTNLLSNALKYTREGGLRLEAGLHRSDQDSVRPPGPQESDWLLITVRDTGPGIAPELHDDLFLPFVRAGAPPSAPGVGLGLTIARELCDALGYHISLASRPGEGSAFHLWIPASSLTTPDQAASSQLTTTAALPTLDVGELPPLRILVADDAPQLRRLIQLELESWGLEVICAEDGAEAIERFRELEGARATPDALLLDWQMPRMDGLEVTRALRAEGCTVPIAAITAAAFREDRESCLEAGCNISFAKPIEFGAVRNWLTDLARVHLGPGPAEDGAPAAQHHPPLARQDAASEVELLRRTVVEHLARQLEPLRVLLRHDQGCIREEQLEGVRRLLHRLVGTIGSFGLDSLRVPLEGVESELRRPTRLIEWQSVHANFALLEKNRLAVLNEAADSGTATTLTRISTDSADDS